MGAQERGGYLLLIVYNNYNTKLLEKKKREVKLSFMNENQKAKQKKMKFDFLWCGEQRLHSGRTVKGANHEWIDSTSHRQADTQNTKTLLRHQDKEKRNERE